MQRSPLDVSAWPWVSRVEVTAPDVLLANMGHPRRPTRAQFVAMQHFAETLGITGPDLVSLGVRLGRIHPHRDGVGVDRLTKREVGGLFDLRIEHDAHRVSAVTCACGPRAQPAGNICSRCGLR